MKRNLSAIVLILILLPAYVQAGGLMTNTNQSASYIRMPVQDAVIGPEGVYFNPAGLAFLSDGLHFSVSNQTISQKRNIKSTFPGMNRTEFEGTVSAPLFPSVYATYKKDRFAFSLGVNPIGGGGSALFEDGLPSFEQQVAGLPATLTQAGINTTRYDFETNFDAQSLFWGFQANASYAINNMLSVSAGLRYVTAKNTYSGYLRNISFNPAFPLLGLDGNVMVSAPVFFGSMAGQFGQLAGVAGSLQQIVGAGFGGLTLAEAMAMGVPGIDASAIASILGGFAMINPAVDPSVLTIAQIQGAYQLATPVFQAQQQAMLDNQALTSDKSVDVTQTGSNLAPILGVHLRLSDRINLAIKYEHRTPLKVENSTENDDIGLYPDGVKIPNDLPSMLSLGGSFGITDKLNLSVGAHYYFDKSAEYGKIKEWKVENGALKPVFYDNDQIIDSNFIEAGLGVEYKITNNFLVSAGYLRTQTGVNELYHSDVSHSLSTNTFGAGFHMQVTELLGINIGGLYSQYETHSKNFPGFTETYDRSNLVFAVGVDVKL